MSTEPDSRSRLTEPDTMERVTFRETESKLADLDALVDADVYPNRSEAIRAAIGQIVAQETVGESE